MKNIFWVVYNKRGKVVSLSKDKGTAKQEALSKNDYRWTFQSYKENFKGMEQDGFTIKKSELKPL